MGLLSKLAVSAARFTPPVAPNQKLAWTNVGDFWNDPRRWDGIEDSHKTLFWAVRRADVIDVREPAKPAIDHALIERQNQMMNHQQHAADNRELLNVRPGSIVRYRPI